MVYFYSTLINFSVVMFIVWYFGKKPANDFLKNRAKSIADFVGSAQKAAAEAMAFFTDWKNRWSQREQEIASQWDEGRKLIARLKNQSEEFIKKEEKRIKLEAEQFSFSEVNRAKLAIEEDLLQKSLHLSKDYFQNQIEEKDRVQLLNNYTDMMRNGTTK
jgi:F0F1-type ATP synthase membrane subunit b/b'